MSTLPSPSQHWSHCTITQAKLNAALSDPSITAIEADILMNVDPTPSLTSPDSPPPPPPSDGVYPVMAHPPSRDSDLKFEDFVRTCYDGSSAPKHLKLDFKEFEVVAPCLETLSKLTKSLSSARKSASSVFLNADVLVGPGKRDCPPTVDSSAFLDTCLSKGPQHALSLGWSCNVARCMNESGFYTEEDAEEMAELVEKFKLGTKMGGVVFAANCRVASKEPSALAGLLKRCKESQLLLWTGTGEPAIRQEQVDEVRKYFEGQNLGDRVGFDCMIAEGTLEGWKNDILIRAINIINWVRGRGI